jgi:hypothetical protein
MLQPWSNLESLTTRHQYKLECGIEHQQVFWLVESGKLPQFNETSTVLENWHEAGFKTHYTRGIGKIICKK